MSYQAQPFVLKLYNPIVEEEDFAEASYNMMAIVEADHYWIHRGRSYQVSHIFSLANGGVHWMGVLPPAGQPIHMRDIKVQGSGAPFEVRLFETNSIDVNSLGTQIDPINLNRESINVSSLGIYDEPVIVSTGTLLDLSVVPVTAKDSGAADEGVSQEWIMANSITYYNISVLNDSGANASYIMKLRWYEPN